METYSFLGGTELRLTAIPNDGYLFNGWQGDAEGTGNPILLTMDSDKTITAQWTANSPPPPPPEENFVLTLDHSEQGSVMVEEVDVTPPPEPLPYNVSTENISANKNELISIPINVKNFANVGAITIKFGYDPAVLSWVEAKNWDSQLSGAANYNQKPIGLEKVLYRNFKLANAVDGVAAIAWDGLQGVNIVDGKLVDLVFMYNGGSTAIEFILPECEIADVTAKILVGSYTNGLIEEIYIPPPPPENGYDWSVPETYNSIRNIPWSSLSGTLGLIRNQSLSGGVSLSGLNNIILHFENSSITNGQLSITNCNGLTTRGKDGDKNNFIIKDYSDKHIRIDNCNDIEIDSITVKTSTSGGQTDAVYCQRTTGFTVRNSHLEIKNNAGGHNDCIQMYRVGGEVLIHNNICLQNNDKTTNNQGIYATTTDRGGRFTYTNNFIGGNNTSGGRSAVKNCLTVRVLPDLGGKPVPVEIRNNKVVSDGYNYVYLTGLSQSYYNTDIRTVNDFSETKYGTGGVNIQP